MTPLSHLKTCLAAGLLIACPTLPSHAEMPPPVDQFELNDAVSKDPLAAFITAFDAGDELTEATFTTERGAGAKVGPNGTRFTRVPRADLKGDGEWARHIPEREAGPVAQSCISCHAAPHANGAGSIPLNAIVDPMHTGDPSRFLHRNTPHLFALGAVQRIAEEMTAELQNLESSLIAGVCESGKPGSVALIAKGISFGSLEAGPGPDSKGSSDCRVIVDPSGVEGVDADLVIRMFGWKGTHASLRAFTRHAAHNELGLQADELVGVVDGDHDGVTGELTVGDMTALTVYMAALERPISKLELADLGLMELEPAERDQIVQGQSVFEDVGCASCHVPTLKVDNPVYFEPSRQPGFFEETFPSGETAEARGLAQDTAIRFDLTRDTPNNHVELEGGKTFNLGAFPRGSGGAAEITWYSDFKRHDMGPGLADPVDAHGFGASVWPTRSLAGVGSTGPWLHHGNATTLDAAIRAHGGEADMSRKAYEALYQADQEALVAFLENLIIIDLDPEEEEEEH